jgi:putative membrane protein
MMHWGEYGWGMGGGLGWLFMILFWLLAVLGIVYLFKMITGGAKNAGREEMPLDILKKRYVKGEISKAEFQEKKKDIE